MALPLSERWRRMMHPGIDRAAPLGDTRHVTRAVHRKKKNPVANDFLKRALLANLPTRRAPSVSVRFASIAFGFESHLELCHNINDCL